MKKKILFLIVFTILCTGILNVKATDKYNGKDTIEYLIRNYNVVTLGTKNRYQYTYIDANLSEAKGSVNNIFEIGGPVLIRGNYSGTPTFENQFAQKTNGIPSYVKGTIGQNINPGSKEGSEKSNIYVGSSNKVDGYKINENQNEYNYPVEVSDNYLDFDKLYNAISNEQKKIPKGTEIETDSKYNMKTYSGSSRKVSATIESPGYYTIDDCSGLRYISIKDYNPNELYVITINSQTIYSLPLINVGGKTSSNSVYNGLISGDTFTTGNVIFNFPNALYIYTNYDTYGHIIAPKADIELTESHYPGTIIANSITGEKDKHTAIQFFPYTLEGKISTNEVDYTKENYKDSDDDLYYGNYSITELLKNYNVVTLGQKDYDKNAKLKDLTDEKGTASIFHISGQFLINGNLGIDSVTYNSTKRYEYSGIKLDFKANELNTDSYIKGKLMSQAHDFSRAKIDPCVDDGTAETLAPILYVGSSNQIYTWNMKGGYNKYTYDHRTYRRGGPRIQYQNYYLETVHTPIISDNYINFKKLYEKIVKQQKNIDKGTLVNNDGYGNAYVKIGNDYNIKNVSELKNIIFTDFESNKDKLTVITIEDTGSISLPIIEYEKKDSKDLELIYTNDYTAGTTYNNDGSIITLDEKYYGNIVWNIPNATHITFDDATPFVGHIVAPNADVETKEFHFAGAMIVNSLYAEGKTEAHFYPLELEDEMEEKVKDKEPTDNKEQSDNKQKEYTTVTVPDTASNISPIIFVISLLLIGVGVRIVVEVLYKKKNR